MLSTYYVAIRQTYRLNATRALIAARLLAKTKTSDLDQQQQKVLLDCVVTSIRTWSDWMCRTFIRNGYTWGATHVA